MIFTKNLYDSFFRDLVSDFTELNIITGYASSAFLKKVLDEFNGLNINLYIGMYNEGISISNHKLYQEITRNTQSNIYYQIKNNPTHMKVYELKSNNSRKCFVGSANFSENGFFYNNEILAFVDELPSDLFLTQLNNSMLCTNEEIENFIELFDDDETRMISENEKSKIVVERKSNYEVGSLYKRDNISLLLNQLYIRKNLAFYNKFSFSVVLPEQNDVSWHYKGINDIPPYIKQNNQVRFRDVFPENCIFKIYAPDVVFECELGGKYNSNLYFLNINIYDYFAKKINITEYKTISLIDLERYGVNKLYFERINEKEFIVKFEE